MNATLHHVLGLPTAVLVAGLAACAAPRTERGTPPNVAPAAMVSGPTIAIADAAPPALYVEILTIDLATAVRVAAAESGEVERARLRVAGAAGAYSSRVGALMPVIAPGVLFEDVDGHVRGVDGPILSADFYSIAAGVLLRWALNPGQAIYDIVAARRRVEAEEHLERHAVQAAIRTAALQYYELVLSQARLSAAQRALAEAEEHCRIESSRERAGLALASDRLLAEGTLAERQRDVVIALDALYQNSISLAVALRLDPLVTLVPSAEEIGALALVDERLPLEDLLAIALTWREDLRAVRALLGVAEADSNAAAWSAFGPQVDAGYQAGAIRSNDDGDSFPWSSQRRFTAGLGWNLSFSSPGALEAADSETAQAALDAQLKLERVRADVIRARQSSSASAQLVPLARRLMDAAEERLRLARSGRSSGTRIELEVLDAEVALQGARLELAQALVRFNSNQIELLAALGVLDEASVLGVPRAAQASHVEGALQPDGGATDP